ncbi:MAG: RsmD family RNA methyltransferase, partial [Acidobacteriia bacterium]|nr:RsmD family RNA methyltransferase [Terriglobia bacterium]
MTQELTIEKLVYGGYGLAFAGDHTYFILNALPGERIRAEIYREKKHVAYGRTVEILKASPLRVDAPCPHFMKCGGCHLQSLSSSDQLQFKKEMLIETFRRLGKISLEEVECIAGEPWGYRTRAQFKIAREGGAAEVGFYAAQSHRVWPVDRCPLLGDRLNEVLDRIRNEKEKFAMPGANATEFQIRANGAESEVALDFVGQPPEFDFVSNEQIRLSHGFINYSTSFGTFRVGSNSFFQVNRSLLERLVDVAVKGAQGITMLDLYAGVGLFSVAASKKFKTVLAVEGNPSAVRDLVLNVERNGCRNVEVLASDVLAVAQWSEERWSDLDFVLCDPPR